MAASYSAQPHQRRQQSQPPQLRHSCDACNIAKVKCSKTRPRCARCEARKVACVYGVSLRSAKGKAESARDVGSDDLNDSSNDILKSPLTSTPMAFSTSMVPHSMMPPPSETSFDASILDGWNTHFSDVGDPPNYSEPSEPDDPVMVLSHAYAENPTGAGQRDPLFSSQRYNPRSTALDGIRTHQSSNTNSPPSIQACFCQQNVLAKLSDCWPSSRASPSPFDKALSENRTIIALCTSTLQCSNTSHTDDTILMLTIVAFLNQIVTIYGSLLLENHSNGGSSGSDLTLADSISVASGTSSNLSSTGRELQSPSLTPPQRVRLSLGSYQLDQRDEQILKANLLVIELGKISDLIDLFERRFCSPHVWGTGVGRGEPKPFGELVTYLRRRLRADQETLRARGSVS